jgi:phosphogluconate dehydratase
VCDKIVPGLLIGALHFGHLPCVFVPAGPMTSGLSNDEKAKVRQQYAQAWSAATALLEAESPAYHGAGTCTFYGTANSNQMLLEIMGLHVPGPPSSTRHAAARGADARGGARAVLASSRAGDAYTPIGRCRRALHRQRHGRPAGHRRLHQPHHPLVAVARAGILIDWDDFAELSAVTRCWRASIPTAPPT